MNDDNTKLFTTKNWVMGISALIIGVSISLVKEYYNTNTIKTQSIIISIIGFTMGLAIVCGVAWWSNKPEEKN